MKRIFITGASSGIGHALAAEYLARGCRVFAASRRTPEGLVDREGFAFERLDLCDHQRVHPALSSLLEGVDHLDVVVLNAGVLGEFGDLADVELPSLKEVMEINVWANKTVVDSLFAEGRTIGQVVAMSSGASVNGNRGWAGYAVSKAALNMLTKLYARERPETHFCALAPGVIDTKMLTQLLSRPEDPRYPSIEVLRSKREARETPPPDEAAKMLVPAFERLPQLVESGAFADVRKLAAPT